MVSLGGAIISNGKHNTAVIGSMISILYELFYFITIPEFTDLCIVGVKEEYQSGAAIIFLDHNLKENEISEENEVSVAGVIGLKKALENDNNKVTNLFLFKNLISAYDYLSDMLMKGTLN